MTFKSQKLRGSARGQACTLRIPGVCNYNIETTVLCHLPDDSGAGIMGGKTEDFIAVFGCSACHDLIDNRTKATDFYKEKYMRHAMIRTWRRWIEMEIVKVE